MDIDNLIKLDKGDAQEFITSINKITIGISDMFDIDEIRIIKIKNWFDHKWLNYSGKSVVEFPGGADLIDSSLNSEWREKITVPPFNPTRVLSEQFCRLRLTDNKKFENPLHKTRDSNDNIHNRISTYTDNGLFVWYSSNTDTNQRGSLMVYRVQNDNVETFYASFAKQDVWEISQTKNIPIDELTKFLNI